MARRRDVLFLSFLFAGCVMGGQQTPGTPAPTKKKPAEEQLPDETSLPEEDESVAPKKYPLNPLEADRNIKVGNQYFKNGHYAGALGRYLDATRYNPGSAEAFFKLGEAHEKLHHTDEAKAAFQKVMKIAPDSKFASEAKKRLSSLKG